MRPAQLTPENSATPRRSSSRSGYFNEAGAINAGKHGDAGRLVRADGLTSMRPAQLTPENRRRPCRGRPSIRHFNEAGAINAGKRIPPRAENPSPRHFNEAGAINAGKLALPPAYRAAVGMTSMRPAQLTPENSSVGIGIANVFAKLQ